jgi:hypothetical protein
MIELTFLSSNVSLSKAFSRTPDGALIKHSYPNSRFFTSHTFSLGNIAEALPALQQHAAAGHCLLKGSTIKPLVNEPRAGSTLPSTPTNWICFDLDHSDFQSTDEFLAAIGCAGVSHIVQYSASYGIETDRGLTAHLFMELDQPVDPAVLKRWLMQLNLTVPALATRLQLSASFMALRWALDITTCQNDKLLYIAPPKLDAGVTSTFTGERISYHPEQESVLPAPQGLWSEAKLSQHMHAQINLLRTAQGLPAREYHTRLSRGHNTLVLAKPDLCAVTGVRQARGYTYLNLNGGDSFAYWHPDEDASIISNFKGEPAYLAKELIPEYYAAWLAARRTQLVARREEREEERTVKALQQEQQQAQKETLHATGHLAGTLVFRDFATATYYNGTWDGQELVLAPAKNETQLQHFLLERGLPEIDFVPTWNMVFMPNDTTRVDIAKRQINLWQPTPYQLLEPRANSDWPTIARVIESAVAHDPLIQQHWLNWWNCVFQLRTTTCVGWVFHGMQGTGKGVLINHVLAPLLGRQFVTIKRMEELEDRFNDYLENTLLVVIDEAQISDSLRSRMIISNLKNQITEPTVNLRAMRQAARSVRNHTNWLFLSNMPDPITIDNTDRRFNVGEFRQEPLLLTTDDIAKIADELPHFAAHLLAQQPNLQLARTILHTEERTRIIQTSRTSLELVADALHKGNLELFWEELPDPTNRELLGLGQQLMFDAYVRLITAAIQGTKNRFSRDELRVLFEFLCGDMPRTPMKFTQLLRHRNITLKPMWLNEKTVRAFEVRWQADPAWLAARRAEISATPKLKAVS